MTADPMTRLTKAQRRHLGELATLGREAFWCPANAGEWRCAGSLASLGLLDRVFQPAGYLFTQRGWEFAQGVRDAH